MTGLCPCSGGGAGGGLSSGSGPQIRYNPRPGQPPLAEEYQGITAGKPHAAQAFNNLRHAYHHLSRSQEMANLTSKDLASSGEKLHIKHCLADVDGPSEVHVLQHLLEESAAVSIVDYIVWRRSALYFLVVSSLVLALLSVFEVESQVHGLSESSIRAEKPFPLIFEDWQVRRKDELILQNKTRIVDKIDLSFLEFSKDYMHRGLLTKWQLQREIYQFVKRCAVVFMQVVVLGCVAAATATWASWKRSGWWLQSAWIAAFATPFVPTFIPISAVTSMESVGDDMPHFVDSVALRFDLKDQALSLQKTVVNGCTEKLPKAESTVLDMKQTQEELCRNIPRLQGVSVFGAQVVPSTIDVKNYCARANEKLMKGDIEEAGKELKGMCNQVMDNMETLDQKQGEMHGFIQMAIGQARNALLVLVSIMNAITGVKSIWPAALSLGPGLLSGALRAKALVPEASIPGIFVILLPWLYAPLSWALYNIVMQASGSLLVMAMLFVLAFAPLGVSVLTAFHNANSPMTSGSTARLVQRLAWWRRANFLIACCCLVAFLFSLYRAYRHRLEEYLDQYDWETVWPLIRGLLDSELGAFEVAMTFFSVFASFFFKFFLTAMVFTDWMLHVTALQRQFENLPAQKMSLPQTVQEAADEIHQGRTKRLVALVIATGGQDERPIYYMRALPRMIRIR